MTKEFDERNAEKSRAVCAAMAETANTGKRVLTERERRILDMWPRFEDSEYVWFGDEVACRGKACMLDDVKFVSDGTFHDETYLYVSNGLDVFEVPIAAGERVKRPARSVLDADGVEIKVGDTVWTLDGLEGVVTKVGDGAAYIAYESDYAQCEEATNLTHVQPDSWERLEEDAELNDETGLVGGNLDIVRRAKALARVEVD